MISDSKRREVAQFKGSEEYLLKVRSEDKSFNLMCSGNC